jgi:cystathionine beta-lyase/cystathionine gamma-synthase
MSTQAAKQRERWMVRSTPIVPPIYQAATYLLDDQSYADIHETRGMRETWYSRFGNPTSAAAADEIRQLEGAEAGLMTSSGMAAIGSTLVTLCRAGERIVAAAELYGDTRELLARDLTALGIEVELVDASDLGGWERALARPARLVFAETLSNPQLRLLDIPAVAELAHQADARLVVDNTFASPYAIRPLELGADVVVHSVTKFLNGHSDVTAGCVLGDRQTVESVQRRVVTFGGCLDPHAAYLVWRGLQTFELRLERQNQNARLIADHLAGHTDVEVVHYPGRDDYLDREIAKRILKPGRCGAMVTFVVAGGDERAMEVMGRLMLPAEATSLGGVESLVSAPFNSSHFMLSAMERHEAGIVAGMPRLSVGSESAEALIADLDRAFAEREPLDGGGL